MATLRLVLLQDNRAARADLQMAHGLSVLVETPDRRVLFDTGCDGTTVANAQRQGISLESLDAIVLSHGHWDHVGGLEAVLGMTGPVPVIAHPGLFVPAYAVDTPEPRYIGPPRTAEEYASLGARWVWAEEPTAIGDHLLTTGSMVMPTPKPPGQDRFVRRVGDVLTPDLFADETGLLIRAGDGVCLLSGCAHVGAMTMVAKAQDLGFRVDAVIGGLHLGAYRDEEVLALADSLARSGTRQLMPCHCTGVPAVEILSRRWTGDFIEAKAGSVLEWDSGRGRWKSAPLAP